MTLSRVKNWVSEVLTASDLNAEFNNILNFVNIPVPSFDGIKFPASQVASADPNTLDDYEEGTWVPSVGGTATYSTQTGTYTKIGRNVIFRCTLTINLIGTGNPSVISGLPVASAVFSSVGVGYFTGLALSVTTLAGYITGTGTTITLTGLTVAGANITDGIAVLGNSARVEISGSYQV